MHPREFKGVYGLTCDIFQIRHSEEASSSLSPPSPSKKCNKANANDADGRLGDRVGEGPLGGQACSGHSLVHTLLCSDSQAWSVITRPSRQSADASSPFAQSLPGAVAGLCTCSRTRELRVCAGNCLELALLWPDGRPQGWVSADGILAAGVGSLRAVEHHLPFLILGSYFVHKPGLQTLSSPPRVAFPESTRASLANSLAKSHISGVTPVLLVSTWRSF